MAHIDKLDQGTRISEAFKGVLKSDFKDDVTARVVNMNGTLSFAKHLINSVIFQSSLMSNGRCELFMCLPPPLFIVKLHTLHNSFNTIKILHSFSI